MLVFEFLSYTSPDMQSDTKSQKKGRISLAIVGIICLILWYLGQKLLPPQQVLFFAKWTQELTNPWLNYEYGKSIMDTKEIDLEDELTRYIQQKKYANETTHVSVYYRNLNNGNRFGINVKEMFSPASLMKLPILLVYLKLSEQDPSLLQKKLTYIADLQENNFQQNVPPEQLLIDNHDYSIQELLEHMIKYSDNKASILLSKNLKAQDYESAFTSNDMVFPPVISGSFDNNLRVIDYARFFRILFNASYLNQKDSNYALQLLTQVDFENGLVAGVDKNIVIAHKFGERGIVGKDGREQKQLHDCGIIYYPLHPYILCVMTRGYDFGNLENIVTDISQKIYKETVKKYTE